MAKRQEVETGEFLLVQVFANRPGRYLPLAYHVFEADWLTDHGAKMVVWNTIERGGCQAHGGCVG